MSKEEHKFMNAKISALLQDGSIKQVPHPHVNGWVSNVFLVPKRDGGYRMILNLKDLNRHIQYRKFNCLLTKELLFASITFCYFTLVYLNTFYLRLETTRYNMEMIQNNQNQQFVLFTFTFDFLTFYSVTTICLTQAFDFKARASGRKTSM